MGETKVPEDPKRVVVLDAGELVSAIMLGVKPVGAVEEVEGLRLPPYPGDGAEGIENVGAIEQPNLEEIATLRPDLILSSKLRHEAIFEELGAIASTVFIETTGVTWRENFEKNAEALGKTE